MALMVQNVVQPVVDVPAADVAAYTTAGWVAASAAQIAAWAASDPYHGTQGAPPVTSVAPKDQRGAAPAPTAYHVRPH